MASATPTSIFPDAMLKRFADRAPGYDRANRFFEEDFTELKQAGYLTAAVPRELGGGGLTFAQVMHEQRRLASHAHATALGINMHLYWTGLAADLLRAGDSSCQWILQEAANGEIFAAGHGEGGGDLHLRRGERWDDRAAGRRRADPGDQLALDLLYQSADRDRGDGAWRAADPRSPGHNSPSLLQWPACS